MRYVYLVFTKEDNGNVTIAGAFTSQKRAWDRREELIGDGHSVASDKVPLNEETSVLLNVWSHGERY